METPATGTPSEMASVRAVTSPMRKPVAPRAGADGCPADVAGLEPGLRQQLLDVLQHAHGPRGALAEHLAVADERHRGHIRGRVKREDQHL